MSCVDKKDAPSKALRRNGFQTFDSFALSFFMRRLFFERIGLPSVWERPDHSSCPPATLSRFVLSSHPM